MTTKRILIGLISLASFFACYLIPEESGRLYFLVAVVVIGGMSFFGYKEKQDK